LAFIVSYPLVPCYLRSLYLCKAIYKIMNLIIKGTFAILKRYGFAWVKGKIWNKEFADGKWDYLVAKSKNRGAFQYCPV
jgi:hypothetical protein